MCKYKYFLQPLLQSRSRLNAELNTGTLLFLYLVLFFLIFFFFFFLLISTVILAAFLPLFFAWRACTLRRVQNRKKDTVLVP